MSTQLWWLATTMYQPLGSRLSRPCTSQWMPLNSRWFRLFTPIQQLAIAVSILRQPVWIGLTGSSSLNRATIKIAVQQTTVLTV